MTIPDSPVAPVVWPINAIDPDPAYDWRVMDRRLGLPDDDQIRRLAARMQSLHVDQDDSAGVDLGKRMTGLYGERAFARYFRLTMDTRLRRYGSQRANFRLADGTVVDVVTRTMLRSGAYPDLTRRKRGRVVSKAIVLIIWVGTSYEPAFPGWCWDSDIIALGRTGTYQDGNPNWIYPLDLLRPMPELMARHRPFDPLAQLASAEVAIHDLPVPEQIIAQAELF